VTDKRTNDDSKYRASIASRGKSVIIQTLKYNKNVICLMDFSNFLIKVDTKTIISCYTTCTNNIHNINIQL